MVPPPEPSPDEPEPASSDIIMVPPDEPDPVVMGAPEALEPDELAPVVAGDPDPPEPEDAGVPEPAPLDPLGPTSVGPPLVELDPLVAMPMDPEAPAPLEPGLPIVGLPVPSEELPHPAKEPASPQRIAKAVRRCIALPCRSRCRPKGSRRSQMQLHTNCVSALERSGRLVAAFDRVVSELDGRPSRRDRVVFESPTPVGPCHPVVLYPTFRKYKSFARSVNGPEATIDHVHKTPAVPSRRAACYAGRARCH